MTIEEAIKHAEEVAEENSKSYEEWLACKNRGNVGWSKSDIEAVDKSIEQCKKCAEEHRQLAEWLKDYKRLKEQEPCEMTAEDYRQRMMQAFHNADCGELIAVCVLPTEKEFEHLEWLLKNHYKKESCGDCISREAVMHILDEVGGDFDSPREAVVPIDYIADMVSELPSVTAQPKIGKWIMSDDGLYRPICNNCGAHPWKGYIPTVEEATEAFKYCPHCGCKIQEVED